MSPHEEGFYWIRINDDTDPQPLVGEWISGRWFVPGNEVELDDSNVTVLSPRLEPPQE